MGKRDSGKRPYDEPISTNPVSMDFEKRSLSIARRSIKGHMLSTPGYGMEYGRYGAGRYGRRLYGARVAIYGADNYGSCVFY